MNKTVATKSTGKRITTKSLRATCPHANVIELYDGAKVCTRCEAVL